MDGHKVAVFRSSCHIDTKMLIVLLLLAAGLAGCRRSRREGPAPQSSADASVVVIEYQQDSGVKPLDAILEREPNDSPSDAQSLPSGKSVQGFIHKPSGPQNEPDRDCYSFKVPPTEKGWVLKAAVTGVPDLRMALEIRNAVDHGTIVTSLSPEKGKGLVITNLSLKPGRYYFRVRERWVGGKHGYNLKTPYILTWSLREQQAGEEREPNNTSFQANDLAVGNEVAGYISRRKDVDWYKVPLSGLDPNARLGILLSGIPGVNAELEVRGPSRNLLAQRKGRRGGAIVLHNLEIPLKYGHFFVVVGSGRGYNDQDRYVLRIETRLGAADTEAEPNDDFGTAMELQGGMGVIKGVLDNIKDVDMYRIAASKPQTLRLELKPDSDLDLALDVYNAKRKRLVRADAGRRGFVETIPNLRIGASVTWLKVAAVPRGERKGGKYLLSFRLLPIEKGDEAEPNNNMAQANMVTPGVSARGFIYPSGDVDYYRFQLTGRPDSIARMIIAVQGIPKVRLKVSLLDAVRNVLAETGGRSAEGLRRIKSNLHVGKWYYIKIQDLDSRRCNSVDSYELNLTREF